MTAVEDYYNVSQLDENPFGEEEDLSGIEHGYTIFLIIVICIRLILYLILLCADIFLMCVIWRFNKLWTRYNVYIFNCCLLHACLYIKEPLVFIIFYLIMYLQVAYHCIEIQSHTALLPLYFTFAFLLAVDWLVSATKPNILRFYAKYYIYFILGLYIVVGIEWGLSTALCMERIHYFLSYDVQINVRTIFYVLIVIGLTIINILKRYLPLNQDCLKSAYALTAANIIVFSYLPMLLHYLVTNVFVLHIILEYIMKFTEVIPEFLALANPLYVAYILGQRNKYFKMAYTKSFKSSFKSYEAEDFNDDSDGERIESTEQPDSEPHVNGTQDAAAVLVL